MARESHCGVRGQRSDAGPQVDSVCGRKLRSQLSIRIHVWETTTHAGGPGVEIGLHVLQVEREHEDVGVRDRLQDKEVVICEQSSINSRT